MYSLGKTYDGENLNKGSNRTQSQCVTDPITTPSKTGCRDGFPNSVYIRPTDNTEINLVLPVDWVLDAVAPNLARGFFDYPSSISPKLSLIDNQYVSALIIPAGDYTMNFADGDGDNYLLFEYSFTINASLYLLAQFYNDTGAYPFALPDNWGPYLVDDLPGKYTVNGMSGDDGSGDDAGTVMDTCSRFDSTEVYAYYVDLFIKTLNNTFAETHLSTSSVTVQFTLEIIRNNEENQQCSVGQNIPYGNTDTYPADTVKFKMQIVGLTLPGGNAGNIGKKLIDRCFPCYNWCYSIPPTATYIPIDSLEITENFDAGPHKNRAGIRHRNPLV